MDWKDKLVGIYKTTFYQISGKTLKKTNDLGDLFRKKETGRQETQFYLKLYIFI